MRMSEIVRLHPQAEGELRHLRHWQLPSQKLQIHVSSVYTDTKNRRIYARGNRRIVKFYSEFLRFKKVDKFLKICFFGTMKMFMNDVEKLHNEIREKNKSNGNNVVEKKTTTCYDQDCSVL